MPSSHLILSRPLLLLPLIPPNIRVFSNESTLRMRWPKYWSYLRTKTNGPGVFEQKHPFSLLNPEINLSLLQTNKKGSVLKKKKHNTDMSQILTHLLSFLDLTSLASSSISTNYSPIGLLSALSKRFFPVNCIISLTQCTVTVLLDSA